MNLPGGYSWDTSQLNVDGTIRVTAVAAGIKFLQPIISGNNLLLSGTGGTPSAFYWLLASTNVETPLSNWLSIATNVFDLSGNFNETVPNALNSGISRRFFVLRVP